MTGYFHPMRSTGFLSALRLFLGIPSMVRLLPLLFSGRTGQPYLRTLFYE